MTNLSDILALKGIATASTSLQLTDATAAGRSILTAGTAANQLALITGSLLSVSGTTLVAAGAISAASATVSGKLTAGSISTTGTITGSVQPSLGTLPVTLPQLFLARGLTTDDFGIVADGSTDVSAALQAAINACAGVASFTIRSAPKPYIVGTQLYVPSNSKIIVDGTMKLKAAANQSIFCINSATNVIIDGLGTLDGNKSAQTADGTAGVSADLSSKIVVRNITINNFKNWPVNVTRSNNVLTEHITTDGCGDSYEFCQGSYNCWARNCTITNILTDYGFAFYQGCHDSGIVNCYLDGNSAGIALLTDDASWGPSYNILIQGNVVRNCIDHSITTETNSTGKITGLQIKDNQLINPGTRNTTGATHIVINNVIQAEISGNYMTGGMGSPSWAILCQNTPTNISIHDNVFYNIYNNAGGVGVLLTANSSGCHLKNNQFIDTRGVGNGAVQCIATQAILGANCSIVGNTVNGASFTNPYGGVILASDTVVLQPGMSGVLRDSLTVGPSLSVGSVSASPSGVEIGSLTTANTSYLDFHSSGNNIDYDTRLTATGGSGAVGSGTLQVSAAAFLAPTPAIGDNSANVATTEFATRLAQYKSAIPTSPAIRTTAAKLADRCDLRDWNGYDDTGTNDMASIVQDAFNQSRTAGSPNSNNVGRELNIPQGLFLLGSTVTSGGGNTGARLVVRGQGVQPTYTPGTGSQPVGRGSVFHIAHPGIGFNISGYASPDGGNAGVTYGNIIEGLATYRDQPTVANGWAPGNFDFDFLLHMGSFDLDLYVHNATKGVALYNAEQSRIRRLRGQPLGLGLDIAACYDIIKCEQLEFWPWYSTDPIVWNYMITNSTAIRTKRADGLHFDNIFTFQYAKGWSVANQNVGDVFHPKSPAAGVPGTTFAAVSNSSYFDSCSTGIQVEPDSVGATIRLGYVNVQPPAQYGALACIPIVMNGANTDVTIDTAEIAWSGAYHAIVQGNGSKLRIAKGTFGDWSIAAGRGADAAFAAIGTPNPGYGSSEIVLGDVRFTDHALVPYSFNGANYSAGIPSGRPLVSGNVRFLSPVTPEMFGAGGQGTTDDTAAVQAAVSTGRTVELLGSYYIKKPITLSTTNQIVRGQGRERSKIIVDGSFALSSKGVIIFNSGEPGPILEDFTVSFGQPTTSKSSDLIKYPPAIYAVACPRFVLSRMQITNAIIGVDMRGNSGGAFIDNLHISTYTYGIMVDGCLDTVRIDKVQAFPFGMPSQNFGLAASTNTCLYVGKVDDIKINDCMLISGKVGAVFDITPAKSVANGDAYDSPGGIPTGCCTNVDWDGLTQMAIDFRGGLISVIGGYFATSYNATVAGGDLSIIGAAMSAPLAPSIVIDGNANLTIANCNIGTGNADGIIVQVNTGGLIFTGNKIQFSPLGQNLSNPKIKVINGRANVTNNTIADRGNGTGTTFVSFVRDDFNVIANNIMPGWTNAYPVGGNDAGIYSPYDLASRIARQGYATPEMFGALGDASHDDTAAFQGALNASKVVRLSNKTYKLKDSINFNDGNVLLGVSTVASQIVVYSDFNMSAPAVVNFGGNGNCIVRDVGFQFTQNSTSYSTLTKYPPCFLGRVAFVLERLRISGAWNVCDMRGNTGQAKIIDVEFGHYNVGWDIDGALDTIQFHRTRGWPYGVNTVLADSLDNTQLIHWRIGRADDIKWSECLHIFGLGFKFYSSSSNALNGGNAGPCFGSIVGHDFDGTWGIDISGGTLLVGSSTFTLGGNLAKQSIKQTGGALVVDGCYFFVAAAFNNPAVALSGGQLTINGGRTDITDNVDVTVFGVTGGWLTLSGHYFGRLAGSTQSPHRFNKAIVNKTAGRATIIGCTLADQGAVDSSFTNQWLNITNDDFDRVALNSAPGWNKSVPSNPTAGLYQFGPNGF